LRGKTGKDRDMAGSSKALERTGIRGKNKK